MVQQDGDKSRFGFLPEEWDDAVRAAVTKSTSAQGLPEQVEDEAALSTIVDLLRPAK